MTGWDSAFEDQYDTLRAYAARKARDPVMAQDLVHEAYLRLSGAMVLAWIVSNQLGTPDVALQAVGASVAALVFVIISFSKSVCISKS